jgi:anti-sigma regulatory factor (Ser/Thr protein kinase)
MSVAAADNRTAPDLVRLQLAGDSDAPAIARRELESLRERLAERDLETVRLLVTELVTNSVRHARAARVDLLLRLLETHVRVEVSEPGNGFERRPRRNGQEGGWGLLLVDALADRWGVSSSNGSTSVWLELSLDRA